MNRKIDFSLTKKLNSISNIDYLSFIHMSNNSIGLSIFHFTINNMKLIDFTNKVEQIISNYKEYTNYNLEIKIIHSNITSEEEKNNIDLDINDIYDYIFQAISNNELNNIIFVLPNYKVAELIEKNLLEKVNVRQYDNFTLKTREIRLSAFYLSMKKEFT